jgi:phage/plasmid-like protein (TIGR03299 family)
MTSEEAFTASGLTWAVRKTPLFTRRPDGTYVEVESHVATQRSDTLDTLGVVGAGYEAWQNTEAFAWTDSLVQDGTALYDVAGSLSGGRRVFLVMRMQQDWRVFDDQYFSYIVVANAHDGTMAASAKATNMRVVCRNTLDASGVERAADVRVRHTLNMRDRLEVAAEALRVTTEQQRRMQAFLENAHRREVTTDEGKAFLDAIIGEAIDASGITDPVVVRRAEKRQEARTTFSRQFLAPEVGRQGVNAYSMLQAATGYADHGLKHRTDETRFQSTLDGRAADLKRKAARFVGELVTA